MHHDTSRYGAGLEQKLIRNQLSESTLLGDTYGVEVWGNYQVNTWWRLTGGAHWLHENLHFEPGSGLGGARRWRSQLQAFGALDDGSRMRLGELNLALRRIGAMPVPASPAYTELDSRLGWTVSRSAALSLTGSNLPPHHLEFGTAATLIQLGHGCRNGTRCVPRGAGANLIPN